MKTNSEINMFFVSNNFINTNFGISTIIIFRIINNKEDKIRFLEKFSISSKAKEKLNLVS